MSAAQGRGHNGNRYNGLQNRPKAYSHNQYNPVQGNTVKKLQAVPARIEESPVRKLSHTTRKNREKAHHMNGGYVFFLAMALIASGLILTEYISLQSDITNSIKHIARLESQLNNLKLANDEEYSRITNSIDLEEIKRVAIQELGMCYAEEGQIVEFAGSRSDYVRQVADIPE